MKLASKLPIIGTKSLKNTVKMFEMVVEKTEGLESVMNFFINGDWHYENKKIFSVLDKLSPEERTIFNCDVRKINWPDFIVNYIKGLSIWALSEDQIEPVHNLKQIIHKNKRRFSDITFAMKPRNNFKEKNTQIYEKSILDQQRFYEFFKMNQNDSNDVSAAFKKAHRFDKKLIINELTRVRCQL